MVTRIDQTFMVNRTDSISISYPLRGLSREEAEVDWRWPVSELEAAMLEWPADGEVVEANNWRASN